MSLIEAQRILDRARSRCSAGDKDSSRPLDCLTMPTARMVGP